MIKEEPTRMLLDSSMMERKGAGSELRCRRQVAALSLFW